ncbi:MAG: T9SS type A sorting domain-containing protein [Crocinitomicaceae bacterium]
MDGRIVYFDMISNQVGGYQKQLNLSNLSDGMYFLRVDTENESITKRIVKQ